MGAYVVGVGGTGARCVESLLHLCAAGLGPKKLFVLLVDPDKANGNLNRVKQLITRYNACRALVQPGTETRLFNTELKLSTENNQMHLAWSPTADEVTLRDYFRYDLLPRELKGLSQLFFTREELAMSLELGFRGHCSVGAPVMARIGTSLDRKPWSDLVENMQQDIGRGENAALFVYASIFGATGASGFPTIGKILRDFARNWTNNDKLRLGGNLLLPYFGFSSGGDKEQEQELRAKAELFLINAKAALNHYNAQWRQDIANPYDALYFLGESRPDNDGREPALGGLPQTNPAHYLEIISGHAALHFYSDQGVETAESLGKGEHKKHFAGRVQDGVIGWGDLPGQREVRDRLVKLETFAAAHLHFFFPLISNPDFEKKNRSLSPWYSRNFRPGELTSGDEVTALKVLREYCLLLSQWLYEIHTYTGGRELHLLNQAVLRRAEAQKYDRWPAEDFGAIKFSGPGDARPKSNKPYDEVLDNMNKIEPGETSRHAGRFADLLYQSVSAFCDKQYSLKGGK